MKNPLLQGSPLVISPRPKVIFLTHWYAGQPKCAMRDGLQCRQNKSWLTQCGMNGIHWLKIKLLCANWS